MDIYNKQPSEQSKIILNALKQVAINEIEKKRRLGQYIVLWENDSIVYEGEDAPRQKKVKPSQSSSLIINKTFT